MTNLSPRLHRCCELIALIIIAMITPNCANVSAAERQTIEITFAVHTRGNGENFRLVAQLPRTIQLKQTVYSLALSPAAREFSENGNRYAEWNVPSPQKKFTLKIIAEVTLYPFDLASTNFAGSDESPQNFLAAENKIESAAPEIIAFAEQAVGTETDNVKRAEKILGAVVAKIKYGGFLNEDYGAAKTLQTRRGDCTDFADLFVAACRSQKIPARHISGMLTKWEQTPAHSWAEFYDVRYGWIPIDPLHTKLGKIKFGQQPARYLELSEIRNDPLLQDGMLYRWEISGTGASADVRQSLSVKR